MGALVIKWKLGEKLLVGDVEFRLAEINPGTIRVVAVGGTVPITRADRIAYQDGKPVHCEAALKGTIWQGGGRHEVVPELGNGILQIPGIQPG